MSVLVVHTYGLQERIGENMRVKVEKYGTIQASKDLLNFLVMALNDATDGQEDKGYKDTASEYREVRDSLFNALDEAGHYDRVRNK